VPKIATPLQNHLRTNIRNIPYLKGIPLAHPVTTEENFEISLLLGADNYWNIIQDNIIRGDGPTAMQSKLGYLLSGPLPNGGTEPNTTTLNVIATPGVANADLNDLWHTPPADMLKTPSEINDQTIIKSFKETSITRSPDGTYCARFPWKTNHHPLPSNYAVCAKENKTSSSSDWTDTHPPEDL
jgi:hypothetical protein